MSMPTTLRADAHRNREQILAAATTVFAEQGPDVPLEEIARAAGVGVGTLYRRFPDREALFLAVRRRSLEALLQEVRNAADEEPRAWDALVRSMSYSRELRLSMRPARFLTPAVAEALHHDPVLQDLRAQLVAVLDRLVAAAQQEGSLRPDVGAGDLAQLFALVYRGADRPDGVAELAASRALAVILDGLSTGPRAPLPGRPLTPADVEPR